jgi:hypothetical protein
VVKNTHTAPWFFHWWFVAGCIYYLIGARELVDNPWNLHIINPAASAVAAHAILFLASLVSFLVAKLHTSLQGQGAAQSVKMAVATLIILAIVVLSREPLRWMYRPYAEQSWQMGMAMSRLARPDDTVVTVANAIGDPIGVYYSRRRGWVFPPARRNAVWMEFPEDEEAIALFEDLRRQGADWFGVVNDQNKTVWQDHPRFAAYIHRTCRLHVETPQYVIYRIKTPQEISYATK